MIKFDKIFLSFLYFSMQVSVTTWTKIAMTAFLIWTDPLNNYIFLHSMVILYKNLA